MQQHKHAKPSVVREREDVKRREKDGVAKSQKGCEKRRKPLHASSFDKEFFARPTYSLPYNDKRIGTTSTSLQLMKSITAALHKAFHQQLLG